MYLYHAVHFDELKEILDVGLGRKQKNSEDSSFELYKYAAWAETGCMIDDFITGVESFPDIVVLSVQSTSIKDNCLEPYDPEAGSVIKCTCTDVIDSTYLAIAWAESNIPLKEFMDLYAQQKGQHVDVGRSEAPMKCVQWFAMGAEKRKAIFNIICDGIFARHFNELAILTGYSADQIEDLWWQYNYTKDSFNKFKRYYEEGLICGMYESGCSIEKIEEKVNWERQKIENLLLKELY